MVEIGTAWGYQTAVLSELAQQVYSMELVEEIAVQASLRLARHGLSNVAIKVGNGWRGWPEHAPLDKVIVAAAPELIPPSLTQQLTPDGKMVIPCGPPDAQRLMLVDKDAKASVSTREIFAVLFSPLGAS